MKGGAVAQDGRIEPGDMILQGEQTSGSSGRISIRSMIADTEPKIVIIVVM